MKNRRERQNNKLGRMRRDGVNLGRKGEDELRKRTKKLGPKKLVQSPQPIHHITHVSRFSSSTPPVSMLQTPQERSIKKENTQSGSGCPSRERY